MDFDSEKQSVDDHNQMPGKADDVQEEETLAMVRQVSQTQDELFEDEDEESSEKYLVDDETWLVIAKQRLLNRSGNTQPTSNTASTTSRNPIKARINRRKTNKALLPLTLDLSSPVSVDSACVITATTATTSISSPDPKNFQDWKHVELHSVPSESNSSFQSWKGGIAFEFNMEDELLDLNGRAIQLAKGLKEMKTHPEIDVPSEPLDLISPTSSDQGLVDEILQRSLSNSSSCLDVDQISQPIPANVQLKRPTSENGEAHMDNICGDKELEDEEEVEEEEDEEDPNETIVLITDKVLGRHDSQDSLERVESLQDDEIPPVQKEDNPTDINLRDLIKESCRRNSKSVERTTKEVENHPPVASTSPCYTLGWSGCAEKRILGATRIDRACPMFLDLSAEGARKLRLKNAGLFRWHMPFRHGLFHQLSGRAEAIDNPLIFAPTGNFYSYLERRKVIPSVYQGPTKRQAALLRIFPFLSHQSQIQDIEPSPSMMRLTNEFEFSAAHLTIQTQLTIQSALLSWLCIITIINVFIIAIMSLWFLLHSQLCLFPLRVTCIENMTRSENMTDLLLPWNQTEVLQGPSKESTGVLLFVNIAVSFFVGGFLLPKLYAKCRHSDWSLNQEVSSAQGQCHNEMENGSGPGQGV